MERLEVQQMQKQLDVKESNIEHSRFENVCMIQSHFEDVNMAGTKIMNANLSDLEIEGAQIGGAYIHNIGMPPKGHPLYDPLAKMQPARFENCSFAGSAFTNCDFSGVALTDCTVTEMKINGIPVEDLLKAYRKE